MTRFGQAAGFLTFFFAACDDGDAARIAGTKNDMNQLASAIRVYAVAEDARILSGLNGRDLYLKINAHVKLRNESWIADSTILDRWRNQYHLRVDELTGTFSISSDGSDLKSAKDDIVLEFKLSP